MSRCERLDKCPFYQGKMDMESGLGAMYRKKYCEGDNTTCARNMLATQISPSVVPITLYPNMVEKAEQLIKDHTL